MRKRSRGERSEEERRLQGVCLEDRKVEIIIADEEMEERWKLDERGKERIHSKRTDITCWGMQ